MLAKLATSRLKPEHAKLLHLEPLPENHGLDISPQYAGFKIPYFLPTGKVNGFYRFRYLQYQPSKGLRAITAPPEKPKRYAQPKDSGCHIYLPPLFDGVTTWAEIMKDTTTPVCITEGELKAACATANAVMATIGLGGVYNWKSSKKGIPLIEDLEAFKWKGRSVYLCFDSDINTNAMVTMAASQLTRTLTDRGAVMHQVDLPAAGAKQGLDDYALAYGVEALNLLFKKAQPIQSSVALHYMNLEVAMIRNTVEVLSLADGLVYSTRQFLDLHKNRRYEEKRMNAKGEPASAVSKAVAEEWLKWPQRTQVNALAYEPGQEPLCAETDYNTWPGWGCVPRKGSVTPWLDLLRLLTGNAESEHADWLKQWFAYPLVHPGEKLYTAVIMWGGLQGTGKTLLGDTMRRIYGRNYCAITKTDLESQFNSWAANHQFIVGDEISTGNKRTLTDKLKDIITREYATVNIKYRHSYDVKDRNNYYFTSNHSDAFFIEDNDRRYFVHEVASAPAPQGFYQRYVKWLDHEGGAGALFHYFLHEVDLTDFHPKAAAPDTMAKREMIRDSKSDIGDWVARLKEAPDTILRDRSNKVLPYALYTAEELLKIYDPDTDTRVTANGLSRELKAAGFKRAARDSNNITIEGQRIRLWAIRTTEKFAVMLPTATGKWYVMEREGHDPKFAQRRPQ